VVTFSAVISACKQEAKNNPQEAFDFFAEMKEAGVKPSLVTFNAMISVCERSSRGSEAMALFEEMKASEILPNVVTYTTLISAFEVGNGKGARSADDVFATAQALFDEMQQSGLQVQIHTSFPQISTLRSTDIYWPFGGGRTKCGYLWEHRGRHVFYKVVRTLQKG
jgi:pentatricopeptide repeat domain-containing protein 1